MTPPNTPFHPKSQLALVALALGSFVISTSEFASMGLLPLFAGDLDVSVAQASNGITAYALGVVIGAPALTVLAAQINRRTQLIAYMLLAFAANLATAFVTDLPQLLIGRFLSGLPQGAYFGAAAMVATRITEPERAGRALSLVMGASPSLQSSARRSAPQSERR